MPTKIDDATLVTILAQIKFDEQGLVPAIAQDHEKGDVVMMAWMNAEAIRETLQSGRVCYWSRSRKNLWKKGETSGQHQDLVNFLIDCDGDTILVKVRQHGVACHTGRRSCFYRSVDAKGTIKEIMGVTVSPETLYSGS
ncbi:phosphoribosyl-AMP cyclohydrolase [Kiloniella laminariae]|uniref:Phosphoribosyl-AMP cyclohydrolase n=1 Tax=Kiloniella laminariae TaxID=454162 RepID=A0ABT4LNJ9_9PROT|nr:phosphoribosyl-AMP cyclohydrolase [Kiloniella laminariae]MCZ4282662.1 phosphoribosyl-AMP cyclohydrolase [Kiloniella laminariae]